MFLQTCFITQDKVRENGHELDQVTFLALELRHRELVHVCLHCEWGDLQRRGRVVLHLWEAI